MFAKTTLALVCALSIGTATAASAQYRSHGYSQPTYGYYTDDSDYRYRSVSPEYRYRAEPVEQGYYIEAPSYGYWQNRQLINRQTGEN